MKHPDNRQQRRLTKTDKFKSNDEIKIQAKQHKASVWHKLYKERLQETETQDELREFTNV